MLERSLDEKALNERQNRPDALNDKQQMVEKRHLYWRGMCRESMRESQYLMWRRSRFDWKLSANISPIPLIILLLALTLRYMKLLDSIFIAPYLTIENFY